MGHGYEKHPLNQWEAERKTAVPSASTREIYARNGMEWDYKNSCWKLRTTPFAPSTKEEAAPAFAASLTDGAQSQLTQTGTDLGEAEAQKIGDDLAMSMRRVSDEKMIRTFETGATRDTDTNKPDYEGFLSPLVLEAFGRYMHKHRIQPDGTLRASDNWQNGIPFSAYMKSMWRHFVTLWQLHRSYGPEPTLASTWADEFEEALCALMFNVMGYLHEFLRSRRA